MHTTAVESKAATLAAGVARGDRMAVADALNLLDDQRSAARACAAALLRCLQGASANTHAQLIGITGPPGAGKSTLGAALIAEWRRRDLRIGVLAVDPSSPISGGALMGDRLRMQASAEDDGVFVRSLSNRGQFGGLSAEVWPMSIVMLAGFDVVMIETVGVGQREIDISSMCDTTCYVAQPGSGDSVQFLKAGILEVPHILVVNKEDMGSVARRTLSELRAALSRVHPDGNWQVPVLATSATNGSGIGALADAMQCHHQELQSSGQLLSRRQSYQAHWIVKKLREEFGHYGIQQLGGEQPLLDTLQNQKLDLFHQFDTLSKSLCYRPGDASQ